MDNCSRACVLSDFFQLPVYHNLKGTIQFNWWTAKHIITVQKITTSQQTRKELIDYTHYYQSNHQPLGCFRNKQ